MHNGAVGRSGCGCPGTGGGSKASQAWVRSLTSVTFTNMTFLVHGHPSFPEDNAVCE